MRNLPHWADGALFGILFIPLAFFLKVTCPITVGCFIDPFFVIIFSPLFLFEALSSGGIWALAPKTELFFIACFWSLVCGLLAHLAGKIFKKQTTIAPDDLDS